MLEGDNLTIKIDQLIDWGLLKKVRREELIDNLISNVNQPNEQQKITIVNGWMESNKLNSQEDLKRWCLLNGFQDWELQRILFREWRWKYWCAKNFKEKISSYYLERKPFLDQVSYFILRVKEKALANELFIRINEGEASFEDMASNYSEGPERQTLGKVGPVPMSQPHPKLARLLQISKPGQIWPPKKVEEWWIVTKLTEIINTELNDKIYLQLALELGEKKLEEALKAN